MSSGLQSVPYENCTSDLVTNFCGSVLLFASPAVAENWTKDHEGTFAISLDEAFELGAGPMRATRLRNRGAFFLSQATSFVPSL
jgi:hypothetical protein